MLAEFSHLSVETFLGVLVISISAYKSVDHKDSVLYFSYATLYFITRKTKLFS